jgi:hypothetical protein
MQKLQGTKARVWIDPSERLPQGAIQSLDLSATLRQKATPPAGHQPDMHSIPIKPLDADRVAVR